MGVTYTAIRIDPDRYDRVASDLEGTEFKRVEDLKEVCDRHARSVDDYVFQQWHEGFEEGDQGLVRDALNDILYELVKEEEWQLGRSLGRELGDIIRTVPALGPFKRIAGFQCDVTVPPKLSASQGRLAWIWSSNALQDCMLPIRQFAGAAAVAAYSASLSFSWLDKLRGRERRLQTSLTLWKKEDVWAFWRDLCEAVESTVAKQHHLGLAMDT